MPALYLSRSLSRDQPVIDFLGTQVTNPFVGPPEKGSRGCVRLLADPELATATGGYYSSAKLKKSSKKSRDHDAQDRGRAERNIEAARERRRGRGLPFAF